MTARAAALPLPWGATLSLPVGGAPARRPEGARDERQAGRSHTDQRRSERSVGRQNRRDISGRRSGGDRERDDAVGGRKRGPHRRCGALRSRGHSDRRQPLKAGRSQGLGRRTEPRSRTNESSAPVGRHDQTCRKDTTMTDVKPVTEPKTETLEVPGAFCATTYATPKLRAPRRRC